MNIAFRVDASLLIGTGHVMRCLTLADALRERGHRCRFICRDLGGSLIGWVRSRGYEVMVLPAVAEPPDEPAADEGRAMYGAWLTTSQEADAAQCVEAIRGMAPDWLIVDHYALDQVWERVLRPHTGRLMLIDDLADRPHCCDLLLDQTLGREPDDYAALVPEHARLLCGTDYALLRLEFGQLRERSLARRRSGVFRRLLISMGGVDKDNVTTAVLEALCKVALAEETRILVVMGSTAPWLERVLEVATSMPWPTEVRSGVDDMARLMCTSDLAIGAAGATSWERCCLGLPTLMLVLAENQRTIARQLGATGAVVLLNDPLDRELPLALEPLAQEPARLRAMSENAARLVDGAGTMRVVRVLES